MKEDKIYSVSHPHIITVYDVGEDQVKYIYNAYYSRQIFE